jgi:hypothetical protein
MSESVPVQCVGCGRVAPQTDTAYTLIGQRHGWRLLFIVDEQGRRLPEWRCPECFRRAKATPGTGAR